MALERFTTESCNIRQIGAVDCILTLTKLSGSTFEMFGFKNKGAKKDSKKEEGDNATDYYSIVTEQPPIPSAPELQTPAVMTTGNKCHEHSLVVCP